MRAPGSSAVLEETTNAIIFITEKGQLFVTSTCMAMLNCGKRSKNENRRYT
jgi:hypothetical protein